MGSRFLSKIGNLLHENKPIIFPAIVGFLFFLVVIQLFRTGKILFGIIFLACVLCLFYVSWYHYRKKGTPYYGKTITSAERWEEMPGWKKLAVVVFILLFLLLWGYLVVLGISGGVHPEYICIGSC
jgi:ABC-type Fe3+ transport system permease subunit